MKKFQDYLNEEDYLTSKLFNMGRVKSDNYVNEATDKCYVFSNEYLSDYMGKMKLAGKRVATVGSSGDQVLNALYYGSKDVTLIDGNPHTRAFVEYKFALIKTFDYNTFICLFKSNRLFNWKIYQQISHMLSKPVQQFWDTLILEQQQVDGKSYEEDLDFVLNTFDDCALYNRVTQGGYLTIYSEFFENEEAYNRMKKILNKRDYNLEFIVSDISKFPKNLEGKYDAILLSNIYNYVRNPESRRKVFFKTVQKLYDNNLNSGGTIQFHYSYGLYLKIDTLEKYFKLREEKASGNYVYFIDKPAHQTDEEHNILF